jgi:hypothetical protein
MSALWLGIRALKNGDVAPLWWWPAVVQVVLLVLWSQNPNANHGGTPGMNRWVLSLLALSLPWLAEARARFTAGTRVAFNIVLTVTAVMTAVAHLPSQPESYRAPTRLAARLWEAGLVHVTPAEVFAERTQGREPAFAPSHDGRCRVILIANQQAPVQCAPPTEPLPSSCRASGAMCYAIAEGDRWRYVSAPANGFFYQVAEPSWPAGGPLAAGIHRVLHDANPAARVWRAENPRRWRERIGDADIGVVLSSPGVTVIHIQRLSEATRLRLVDDRTVTVTPLIASGTADLPSALTNVAVVIRR